MPPCSCWPTDGCPPAAMRIPGASSRRSPTAGSGPSTRWACTPGGCCRARGSPRPLSQPSRAPRRSLGGVVRRVRRPYPIGGCSQGFAAQGRALLRTGRRVWPSAALETLAAFSDRPPLPIVHGAVASRRPDPAGRCPRQRARHRDGIASARGAAARTGPIEVSTMLAGLAGEVGRISGVCWVAGSCASCRRSGRRQKSWPGTADPADLTGEARQHGRDFDRVQSEQPHPC